MMEVAGFFLASKWPCPTPVLIACIYVNIYFTTMEYKVGLQSPNYLSEDHLKEILREDIWKNIQSIQSDDIRATKNGHITNPGLHLSCWDSFG